MNLLARLPVASRRRIALYVKPAAERAARHGHPWIFEDSIVKQSHQGSAGDLAVVFDKKQRFLAIGLYDPFSPIRVRLLHSGRPTPIDNSWLAGKLERATALRNELSSTLTTAYRLVHGENDGLPGLVIDRYANNLVLKIYTSAWVPYLADLAEALEGIFGYHRLILRLGKIVQQPVEELFGLSDGLVLSGSDLPDVVSFLENGLHFQADLIRGQKTGFFLDQRENRARTERLVASVNDLKKVLNVFAYTGAFSLYAARGGARSIQSVDVSSGALAIAERHFQINSDWPAIVKAKHAIRVGDAFQVLEELNTGRQRFDLVIVDPPSFARSGADVEKALAAYRRLAGLAIGIVRPGGVLVMCSCTGRVSSGSFYRIIQETAREKGRTLQDVRKHGHPRDHPIGFAQGEYLKCLMARIP